MKINLKLKVKLLIGILAVALAPFAAARADDTTEVFEPGLSDLEGYYSQDRDQQYGYEWVVGYGVNDRISLTWAYGVTQGQEVIVPSYSAGLFINVLDNLVALDLMAGMGYEELPRDEGDDPNSYSVMTEITVPNEIVVPYTRFGYEWVDIDSTAAGYPITAGLLFPVYDGVELITGYDWFQYEDNDIREERSASVGLNILLTDEFELISEYRQTLDTEEDKWNSSVTVGFILTMEKIGKATSLRRNQIVSSRFNPEFR